MTPFTDGILGMKQDNERKSTVQFNRMHGTYASNRNDERERLSRAHKIKGR